MSSCSLQCKGLQSTFLPSRDQEVTSIFSPSLSVAVLSILEHLVAPLSLLSENVPFSLLELCVVHSVVLGFSLEPEEGEEWGSLDFLAGLISERN